MTKLLSYLLFLFALASTARAQAIKGILLDEADRAPVAGATVNVVLQNDSTQNAIKSTVTDKKGNFEFSGIADAKYLVKISFVGYQKLVKPVVVEGGISNLGMIIFKKQGKDLADVTIIATAPAAAQNGDTTQFSASQYKVNPDATTEDLIKKMPGITVAKDGTVTAQGEQVKKVTVDGKDFFGDDATVALKNIPSEIVSKIQVFDKLSDQAQLTGFDDGNSVKAINIVTKTGIKNSQFGRVYAGYGTDDRYAAGGNMSFFKDNRRISLVGNFNNINQQNFGSQDLLGVSGGGGGRRGGRGGGSENFSVGQAPGISKTNAFGINYSDQWGKKLTVTGSYFFNNSNTDNTSLISTETFSTPENLNSIQATNAQTENTNNRINLRLEYKIDSNNSIFFIPSVNFQSNNSTSNTILKNFYSLNDSISNSLSNVNGDKQGYNIRNNILYRHSFAKRGRSFSVGFNTNYTKNDGNTTTDAMYRFFNDGITTDSLQQQLYDNNNNGNSYSGRIEYTEPIGKKGQLQINYSPSVLKNKTDQETFSYDGKKYSIFDTSLSNYANNTITTNNAGISYRLVKGWRDQFSIGTDFQNATLESQQIYPYTSSVNQSFFSVLPNARWIKKLSSVSNIRVFYRARANFPSADQLQNVVNLSDPLRVSTGNPNLKQSISQFVGTRYSYTNTKTNKSFFANVFFQSAADYITNATNIAQKDSVIQQGIVLKKGSQLITPVNLDGYKNLRSYFNYSMPIKAIKTTLNVNAGFSYAKLPGMINNINSITNSVSYNAGVVLASNISEYVDFNLTYNASINNATTISNITTKNNYINHTAGIQVNLLSKNGWFIQNDVTGQLYNGLSENFNQSYWLWNAAIGKKFLKKQVAELKISVFDLLKQNQSFVRTVTGTYVEDAQNQVLQQYFMLTFTYSLKNFGKPAKRTSEEFDGRGGGYRPGRRGPNATNPSF
jgi:hypothetical protein